MNSRGQEGRLTWLLKLRSEDQGLRRKLMPPGLQRRLPFIDHEFQLRFRQIKHLLTRRSDDPKSRPRWNVKGLSERQCLEDQEWKLISDPTWYQISLISHVLSRNCSNRGWPTKGTSLKSCEDRGSRHKPNGFSDNIDPSHSFLE